MIRTFMPLLGVVIAIGLYFVAIAPGITVIRQLQHDSAQYAQALEYAQTLRNLISQLQAAKSQFTQEELTRLERFLPDSVDSVQLARDTDAVAEGYGAHITELDITDNRKDADVVQGGVPAQATAPSEPASLSPDMSDPGMAAAGGTGEPQYSHADFEFTVNMTYDNLISFLQDIESNIQLMDANHLTFTVDDEGDLTGYNLTVRTYWLQ